MSLFPNIFVIFARQLGVFKETQKIYCAMTVSCYFPEAYFASSYQNYSFSELLLSESNIIGWLEEKFVLHFMLMLFNVQSSI